MLINNITGTNSLHTNCERDTSTSILGDIHKFILDCNKVASHDKMDVDAIIDFDPNFNTDESEHFDVDDIIEYDPDCDEEFIDGGDNLTLNNENDVILFDPQLVDDKVNYFQDEALSRASFSIRQKIIKIAPCDECKTVLGEAETPFVENCKQILHELKEIVPTLCVDQSLKKKILASIKSTPFGCLGCANHDQEVSQKLKEMCVDFSVTYFIDDINRFLKGSTTVLPINYNTIQKLAFDQFDQKRKKKKIGKYSDIFNS